MKSYYQLNDPFTGKTETELYSDTSLSFIQHDFYTQVLFDALISAERFTEGAYTLLQFSDSALNNKIGEKVLRPVTYQQDKAFPSMDEVMLNPEDTFKSSLMIHKAYSQGFCVLDIECQSEGAAVYGKTAHQLQSNDLIGRISFKQENKQESYSEVETYYETEEYQEEEIYYENEQYVAFPAGTVYKQLIGSAYTAGRVTNGGNFNQAMYLWRNQEPNPTHVGYNRVAFTDWRSIKKTRIVTKTRQIEKQRTVIKIRYFAQESYTHRIANGQVYNPEVYPEFYRKFGTKWGGTSTAPKLPNLIGSFPRNIGTSGSAFSSYFNNDNSGVKYIQRIPKIKWMNHLVSSHEHSFTTATSWWEADSNYDNTNNWLYNWNYGFTDSVTVSLKDNNWNNIQTGANVNLSNFEFTDRFEPKCIEVIPFIRMI